MSDRFFHTNDYFAAYLFENALILAQQVPTATAKSDKKELCRHLMSLLRHGLSLHKPVYVAPTDLDSLGG